MRAAALLLALAGCAAARPSIGEVVSAFDDERGGLRVVVIEQSLAVGSRWELIDDQGALGEAVVTGRDPAGFCDDAVCTFYDLRLLRPARRPRHGKMLAIGPITSPLPRARLVAEVGVLAAIDLDGDGRVDLELREAGGADDEDCFELRERPARLVWRRCHARHF